LSLQMHGCVPVDLYLQEKSGIFSCRMD